MQGAVQQGVIVTNLLETRSVCIVICFVVEQAFTLKVATLRESFGVLKKESQNNNKKTTPKQKPQQQQKSQHQKTCRGKELKPSA